MDNIAIVCGVQKHYFFLSFFIANRSLGFQFIVISLVKRFAHISVNNLFLTLSCFKLCSIISVTLSENVGNSCIPYDARSRVYPGTQKNCLFLFHLKNLFLITINISIKITHTHTTGKTTNITYGYVE